MRPRVTPIDIDARNDAVWRTEWEIAHAGARIVELPCGPAAHDCDRGDTPGSHVIWARHPERLRERVELPCAHRYRVAAPTRLDTAALFPGASNLDVRESWAMWLEPRETVAPTHLSLHPLRDDDDWETMLRLRRDVERAFSGGDPDAAPGMVEAIRHRRAHLDAEWYLARADGEIVGGVGLVVVRTEPGLLGRLQDVDIHPTFQGRGLGRELLRAIEIEARRHGCDALCLRADAADWPKEWYRRLGFTHVGTWTGFNFDGARTL